MQVFLTRIVHLLLLIFLRGLNGTLIKGCGLLCLLVSELTWTLFQVLILGFLSPHLYQTQGLCLRRVRSLCNHKNQSLRPYPQLTQERKALALILLRKLCGFSKMAIPANQVTPHKQLCPHIPGGVKDRRNLLLGGTRKLGFLLAPPRSTKKRATSGPTSEGTPNPLFISSWSDAQLESYCLACGIVFDSNLNLKVDCLNKIRNLELERSSLTADGSKDTTV